MTDDRHETGMSIRREVLGDAHVDRAIADTVDFTASFQDFITSCVWADIWGRDGLSREVRSAVTLAVLTALGREGELELHVRGALRNGLTPEQIAEVLLHTSVYAGIPAANAAFGVAREVLEREGAI